MKASLHLLRFEGVNKSRLARTLLPLWLIALLVAALVSMSVTAQRRTRPASQASAASSSPSPTTAVKPTGNFDTIAAQASAAREADKIEEAIALYRQGVSLRPDWAEGWWFLATLYYDKDQCVEAIPGFKRAGELQKKAGAPWAMVGLCEFQLAKYDDAKIHIDMGRRLGVGDNLQLIRVMRYHEGLLSILKGEFEKAQETLDALSYEGLKSEELIIALGLSILRIGMTPKEITINYPDRALIRRAGLAEHFAAEKNVSDAQREYDMIVRDFGTVANVQYAYGRFLLVNRDDENALLAFERELKNWPKHTLARCQIANIKLRNRDIEGGLPLAEEAVKLSPRLPLAHYVLGRLLYDAGQNDRAITELELVASMVPQEAKVYFALARAYTKAKRKQDADKARAIFTKLSESQSEGSVLPDDSRPENPTQP